MSLLDERLARVLKERHERKRAYSLEYYRAHKEKINSYRAEKRHQEHLDEMHRRWKESQDVED